MTAIEQSVCPFYEIVAFLVYFKEKEKNYNEFTILFGTCKKKKNQTLMTLILPT